MNDDHKQVVRDWLKFEPRTEVIYYWDENGGGDGQLFCPVEGFYISTAVASEWDCHVGVYLWDEEVCLSVWHNGGWEALFHLAAIAYSSNTLDELENRLFRDVPAQLSKYDRGKLDAEQKKHESFDADCQTKLQELDRGEFAIWLLRRSLDDGAEPLAAAAILENALNLYDDYREDHDDWA